MIADRPGISFARSVAIYLDRCPTTGRQTPRATSGHPGWPVASAGSLTAAERSPAGRAAAPAADSVAPGAFLSQPRFAKIHQSGWRAGERPGLVVECCSWFLFLLANPSLEFAELVLTNTVSL